MWRDIKKKPERHYSFACVLHCLRYLGVEGAVYPNCNTRICMVELCALPSDANLSICFLGAYHVRADTVISRLSGQ